MRWAFFGTPDLAVTVLKELARANLRPDLIVSAPDAPIGRKHIITPPPVATYANEKGIPLSQPATLKIREDIQPLTNTEWDLFVVFAYGKILPVWLLELPKHKTINLHPSLLPKLRGASPIRSAILENEFPTGVTIMLMDAEMDHGPILTQEEFPIEPNTWPPSGTQLENEMSVFGGQLLAATIPRYLKGEITPTEQDHTKATFCQKITKNMAELILNPHELPTGETAEVIFRKIQAFTGWPEAFFIHEGKRIKIRVAHLDPDKQLVIDRIVPEGKSEMNFKDYFR
jgi:methionyl-tRNA formyltransferase